MEYCWLSIVLEKQPILTEVSNITKIKHTKKFMLQEQSCLKKRKEKKNNKGHILAETRKKNPQTDRYGNVQSGE